MRLVKMKVWGVVLLALVAGSRPAWPQGSPPPAWNLYEGLGSVSIPLARPVTADLDGYAKVNVIMGTGAFHRFSIDTGSTGIAVSSDVFKPGPLDTKLEQGSIIYTSDGRVESGTFYMADVRFLNPQDANRTEAIAKVKVLLVSDVACPKGATATCKPSSAPTGISWMGVGFDRSAAQGQSTTADMNPFLNLTWARDVPIEKLRPGYIITTTGAVGSPDGSVKLGLDAAATKDFAFVKLTPNTALPSDLWNRSTMAVTVGGVTRAGVIVQDSGINYMILSPPDGSGLVPGTNAPPATDIKIWLPGREGAAASYNFKVDEIAPNPLEPTRVSVVNNGFVSVNTGRQFFLGFDFLYDSTGGFVGYRWNGSVDDLFGFATPGLSLKGPVVLPDGFASSLPTFLFGATTLQQTGTGTISGDISGSNALTITGGRVNLSGSNSYTGGTTVSGGGTVAIDSNARLGDVSGALVLDGGRLLATGNLTGSAALSRPVVMGAAGGTFDTNGFDLRVNTPISGPGSLTKRGFGIMTLEGANSYAGGTIVNEGTLRLAAGASLPMLGALTVNGGTFDFNGNDVSVGALSGLGGTISMGSGSLTVTEAIATTLAANITGTGGLSMVGTGTLNLTGINSYTGPTSVTNGRLAVNGSITSDVTVGPAGTLGGTGIINGAVNVQGAVAPGNSIGTLNVVGSYTQAPGSFYQVETNAAGQADLISVTGAPGTATINGGTVTLTAASGVYAPSTTYTILTATGGVTGAYAGTSSLFPFLQPSLSYDANNVYMTLKPGGFAAGAQTANQAAVGRVLDWSVAGSSGDFATVIGTMATYTSAQGQAAMNAISGQNYAGVGTANLGGGLMFMNTVGQQMSAARGTGNSRDSRAALALACDVTCDSEGPSARPSPWSVWGSAMGGTGSVAGGGNAATLTYNAGGFATGLDHRFDPRFLAGVGIGYASGSQWLGGFSGQGTTNSYQASLYASFTQAAFYLDGLVGYGYNDNQMMRQIVLPNLAARVAQGRAGANQLMGQVEAGYRIGLHERAAVSITPFARFEGTTVSQVGFSENGAGSLNLNVAAQTTGSARSVLGAEFAGAFGSDGREKLALQLRLGWAHEYASTSRPVTANFAGAPGSNFTVFGAAPQTDSAIFSLAANTVVAAGASLYLRYDGEMGAGTSSHALNGGLRVSW